MDMPPSHVYPADGADELAFLYDQPSRGANYHGIRYRLAGGGVNALAVSYYAAVLGGAVVRQGEPDGCILPYPSPSCNPAPAVVLRCAINFPCLRRLCFI